MPLDPEVANLLQAVNASPGPPLHTLSLEAMRQAMDEVDEMGGETGQLASVTDRTIPLPGADLPLRLYTPLGEGPFPILLFIHGGCWIAGSIAGYDKFCRHLAVESGCLVASVGYRLAPEQPFPAGLEDCYAAAVWLTEHAASLQGDATRLAIGGDSSGGNLATVVTMLARERQGPKFRYQVLLQPITDYYRPGTASYEEFAEGYVSSKELYALAWRLYVPDEAKAIAPYASPLRAENLADLPPALIVTAEYDMLRDEGESYARCLQEAGVPVVLKRYDGMIHPFMRLAGVLRQGKAAMRFVGEQLRAALKS
ncbi:alpha/beta hydrolase [Ktedonosporobacter rubrisoli]|uniref:Alpha/beta hydrolase n=1 Tax=Ktedonosporobacter rubrisoli TaxID=2509675 RepID=A0A4V0YZS0_KTERU|nr:alpha/beta hydrolase [Ktedonosporobacter rubrisoli]QBD80691.1 alpha/beta hydrolase [Ktedonosporobacter rubrisoli]